MPPLSSSLTVLGDHVGLGAVAALLFVAGVGTAVPVVRNDVRWLMALPLWLFRQVLRLIGPRFPPVRTFLVIFLFNGIAIFAYMMSGVLVVLPAVVAFLTGLNIGVAVLKAQELALPLAEPSAASASGGAAASDGGLWVGVCSVAVLFLELPSFWVSVGMGIGLGRALTASGGYALANLRGLLVPRVGAYVSVVLPVLFVSALAETAAIRGHLRGAPAAPEPPGPRQDAPPDEAPGNPSEPDRES